MEFKDKIQVRMKQEGIASVNELFRKVTERRLEICTRKSFDKYMQQPKQMDVRTFNALSKVLKLDANVLLEQVMS